MKEIIKKYLQKRILDSNTKKTFNIIELFGGIGAFTCCMHQLADMGIIGGVNILDYVEIDADACNSYNAIYGASFKPQDIRSWDKSFENVDVICHGSPCQDFSKSGREKSAYYVIGENGEMRAGDTRSSLMYETIRIVKKIRPKVVIWENVANLLSEKHFSNFVKYLEVMDELGYASAYQVMNASDYSVPQNRERVFTISVLNGRSRDLFGFELDYDFPKPVELQDRLMNYLDDEVDEKYYLSDKMIEYISKAGSGDFKNPNNTINLDIASPLTCREGCYRAGSSTYICKDMSKVVPILWGGIGELCYNNNTQYRQQNRIYLTTATALCITTKNIYWYLIEENEMKLRIRKLTPKEAWRLMGQSSRIDGVWQDENFNKAKQVCSNTQLHKQAGNSIVVDCIRSITQQLIEQGHFNED